MNTQSTSGKFSVVDALAFIMDGNDSDLSELSSDEEDIDDNYQPEQQGSTLRDGESSEEEEESSEEEMENSEEEVESSEEEVDSEEDDMPESANKENGSSKKKKKKKDGHVFRWRKKDIPFLNINFQMEKGETVEQLTALDYFKLFWTNDITKLVTEQTNNYSVQKSGQSVNTTSSEIEQFIGMHMKMGVVGLPSYTLYWSNEMRYPPVADIMPRKRYEKLRRYLHIVDNMTYDEQTADKLFKVRPLIEQVAKNCRKISPEENHSVDEQIIPSKTKYSKIRQYNPKKPVKWGFKNLVRAGSSGFMYDFYIYAGKNDAAEQSEEGKDLQKSAQVVVKLCEVLPSNAGHKLFFDNWFTTLDLILHLKQRGILACGTVRSNRLQKCPLKSKKELKKAGRGSLDYRSDLNSGIIIVKWLDNGPVHFASNFVGIAPMSAVERWSPEEKKRKDIQCPQVVKLYNSGMGGVDLADMLISLYRIVVKTRRWYIKIFWHCVDICKVNAWVLYRRHCMEQGIVRKHQKSLLKFSLEVADALILENKAAPSAGNVGKPGRPPKRKSVEVVCDSKLGRKPVTPCPNNSIRTDQFGHWPVFKEGEKGRCRKCKTGYSRVFCCKCHVCLCLTSQRNCFMEYHTA